MRPAHHFKTLETAFNTARSQAKFKTFKYYEGEQITHSLLLISCCAHCTRRLLCTVL